MVDASLNKSRRLIAKRRGGIAKARGGPSAASKARANRELAKASAVPVSAFTAKPSQSASSTTPTGKATWSEYKFELNERFEKADEEYWRERRKNRLFARVLTKERREDIRRQTQLAKEHWRKTGTYLNIEDRSYRVAKRYLRSIPQSRKVAASLGNPSSRVRNKNKVVRGPKPTFDESDEDRLYEKDGWNYCGHCSQIFRTAKELISHVQSRQHQLLKIYHQLPPNLEFCPCGKNLQNSPSLHNYRHIKQCDKGKSLLKNE